MTLIVLTFGTTTITTAEAETPMVEIEVRGKKLTSEMGASNPSSSEENQDLVSQRVNNYHWRYIRGHDKCVHQRQFDSDNKTWHEILPC
ncbi:hypothetical protein MKW92_050563 [Papaver armeniacum]|nr:hypothetical protein MKW92_050563 [Papaver armeniacum]